MSQVSSDNAERQKFPFALFVFDKLFINNSMIFIVRIKLLEYNSLLVKNPN